jgi:Family of unknown function (DUF5677)
MNEPTACFGFPNLWDAAYTAHADEIRAIDRVQEVANELVVATKEGPDELVEVARALTGVNSASMSDVLILVGNGRGTGAMKVARSMFEVAVVAEYLVKHPDKVDLYLAFAHVIGWRYLELLDRIFHAQIAPELMREAEAQYNTVKGKFEKDGRVRNNWTDKSLRRLADDIGRADLYDLVYGLASMLHHVNVGALISHDLNWDAEALRIGHGALLQTVTALYNAYHETSASLQEKLNTVIAEFKSVWKPKPGASGGMATS